MIRYSCHDTTVTRRPGRAPSSTSPRSAALCVIRARPAVQLPQAHPSADAVAQLLRIEADALLEDGVHLAHVRNRLRRIAVDDHQVGLLAGRDRADTRGAPE